VSHPSTQLHFSTKEMTITLSIHFLHGFLQKQKKIGTAFCTVLLCMSMSFFLSCNNSPKPFASSTDSLLNEIAKLKQQVKTGDMIFRNNDDMESESLRNFNKVDKRFSHCGITVWDSAQKNIMVYHSFSGKENPGDYIMFQNFDSFVSPKGKLGISIYRFAINDSETHRFVDTLSKYYDQKVRFDKNFNLVDDSVMYCAEYIVKSIERATNNRVKIPTTRMKNTGNNNYLNGYKYTAPYFEYYALDNLMINPFVKEIVEVKFVQY
jgi:hypothetical protein